MRYRQLGAMLVLGLALISHSTADHKGQIKKQDVQRLLKSLESGNLLMGSPMDDGKWTMLIVQDAKGKGKDHLWLYNVSLAGDQLDLMTAQAPILLCDAWPTIFGKTLSQTKPEEVFANWIKEDGRFGNMVTYNDNFDLGPLNNVLASKFDNTKKDYIRAFRYLTPNPKHDTSHWYVETNVTFNQSASKLLRYDDHFNQGVWIAQQLKSVNVSLIVLGKKNGSTFLDTFTKATVESSSLDQDWTKFMLKSTDTKLCITTDSKHNEEVALIGRSDQCATVANQPDGRPFGDVYSGFIAGDHFYFFSKSESCVYVFPLEVYKKPKSRHPLKRMPFEKWVNWQNTTSTPFPDTGSTNGSSKPGKGTTEGGFRTMIIIIVDVLAIAAVIGIIICYWACCMKPDEPAKVDNQKVAKPKGKSKKTDKTTTAKKTKKDTLSKKKTAPVSAIPLSILSSGVKSKAAPKSSIAPKSTLVGGKTSVNVSSSAIKPKAKRRLSKSTVASQSPKASAVISNASSAISKASAIKSKATGAKSKAKGKVKKTVMGQNVSALASLGAVRPKSTASSAVKSSISKATTKKSTAGGPKSVLSKKKK